MKVALIAIMLFGSVIASAEAYRAFSDIKQAQDNKARYSQAKFDRDEKMAKACAAGETGVVLYYKGVNCAKNAN